MAGRIPRGTVSHQKRRKILHDHLLLHRLGAEPGKIRRSRQYGRRLGHVEKIGDETTYQSQAAFLLNLNGQLLYIGDRWNAENYFESGYVAYPLKVENGELVMEYCEETDLGKYL